ncbi:DUF5906 domain-containing protein [Hyphomicrobium sp. CS1GBMeth3]|uniref:DUF5906 domain-containing protein n=1 Tax=Hyphomicrobium sp. CS1GBMeth3 TaxID=1892845 RepID=UPI001114F7EE|nr:DUF5906 domain-containing protein [Hyphomicrobium sp. CS1GBMeth3]
MSNTSRNQKQPQSGEETITTKRTATAGSVKNEPAIARAEKFLRKLDPNTKHFEWRAIHPNGQRETRNLSGTLDNLRDELVRHNKEGYGIFVTVNETSKGRRKKEDVTRVRAVWADWDHGRPNGKLPLKPSMVVNTSPGKYQAYWLVAAEGDDDYEEPLAFDEFDRIMRCIVSDWGGDKGAKDLARVLRVPGFYHTKGTPYQVRFASGGDEEADIYTASELIEAFKPHDRPKTPISSKSNSTAPKAIKAFSRMQSEPFVPDKARELLDFIREHDTNCDGHDTWRMIIFGLQHWSHGSDDGRDIAHEYSKHSDVYDADEIDGMWERPNPATPVTLGSIIAHAQQFGWKGFTPKQLDEVATDGDGLSAVRWGTMENRRWSDDAERQGMLSRMNREHSVVPIGSSVRYTRNVTDEQGRQDIMFMRSEDMAALYQGVVLSGKGKQVVTAFDEWKTWRSRKQYAGVGFYPQGIGPHSKSTPVPKDYLNLWTGWPVEPKQGHWSLFRKHLRKVVCKGNEDHFRWLMDWMAHLVQRPGEKPGSAVVLKSKGKGTGKSMVGRFISHMFGVHAMEISDEQHLTGRFNAHMKRLKFVVISEALWAGDNKAKSKLKTLITDKTLAVEGKGVDLVTIQNYLALLFTSNENWAVPAETDERRYFVLDFESDQAKKAEYFDPIFEQMEGNDFAGVRAMMHDLQNRLITSDLRNPPDTDGLKEQREHGLTGCEKFMLSTAREGCVPLPEQRAFRTENGTLGKEHKRLHAESVREAIKEFCNPYEARNLHTVASKELERFGVQYVRADNKRAYLFPPLAKLRDNVRRALNVNIDG